jgi:hypothetical protein
VRQQRQRARRDRRGVAWAARSTSKLTDGEAIVITSPTDARLQVRITVTATDWYLQN